MSWTAVAPEAAARLLLEQLPSVELRELTRRWHYEAGILPNFEGATKLTKDNLIEIGRWKLDLGDNMGDRAVINRLRENDNERVEAITRAAFDGARSTAEFPSVAVAVLCTLRGVGIPMATTILASAHPKEFGILDRRAWSSLRKVVPDPPGGKAFRSLDVDFYELTLRNISKQCADKGVELTCRDVDKALWQHDKEAPE